MGDQPLSGGSELNAIITTQGRFTSPEQFRAIILRSNPDGSAVTLGDVARVELGAESYLFSAELNGKPMAGMAVQLTPGANALATAQGIKDRMAELSRTFPEDVAWSIPTTPPRSSRFRSRSDHTWSRRWHVSSSCSCSSDWRAT